MSGTRRKTPGREPLGTEETYERIWSAIMDHSLPPETRLVEERLCEICGLGRTRLRQVLQRLAHERVVTRMPTAAQRLPSPPRARRMKCSRLVRCSRPAPSPDSSNWLRARTANGCTSM